MCILLVTKEKYEWNPKNILELLTTFPTFFEPNLFMFSDLLAFGNFRRKYSPDWHNLRVQASHFQWQKTWFWKQIHLTLDAFLIFWKGNLDFLDRTFWLIGFPNVNVSWPSFFWSDFYIISQKRKENSSYWQGSVRVRHRASCPPSPGLCPTHTPCPSSTLGALKLRIPPQPSPNYFCFLVWKS